MLEIRPTHENYTGTLVAKLDGVVVGHIDFRPTGASTIDLYHTQVAPEFEGRGFGRQLVMAAVDFARDQGLTLRGSCPYAARVLDRAEGVDDVWPKSKSRG